jgi:geranylgeranyl pyrophosphate synthase
VSSTVSPLFRSLEGDLAEVEQQLAAAGALEHPLLRSLLEQVMLAPAKRIRPVLTLASGRLFRPANANLHAMAAAVEYLHTATLIHDDVVDHTDARRGEQTLYSMVGNSIAVLVGDYLFAKAAETASLTNNVRIMRLFADSVMTLCAGQIDEVTRHGEADCWISRDEYLQTIDAKTAALFVFACRAGAIIGEASTAAYDALGRYGRALGLAFQVVDDILDLIGDESQMGKPAGSDLRQGVITLPLIYLRDEIPEILMQQALLGDGVREDAIRSVIETARTSRAIDRAFAEARDLAEQAARELDHVPDNEYREILLGLTRTVVDRRM